MTVVVVIVWLVTCALVGEFAARKRNRSRFGWATLALVISPLLAILIVAVMEPKRVA